MNMDADREEKAIQALITGSLHRFTPEVTAEEIEEFAQVGMHPFAGRESRFGKTRGRSARQTSRARGPQLALEVSGEYAAMHRELDADELDEQTKAELQRKREEILKRIREKRGESE